MSCFHNVKMPDTILFSFSKKINNSNFVTSLKLPVNKALGVKQIWFEIEKKIMYLYIILIINSEVRT